MQLTITNQYIQDHVNSENTDVYGINLNLICIQLLINTYHIRAVLHEIGPHGSLLRYENYSK